MGPELQAILKRTVCCPRTLQPRPYALDGRTAASRCLSDRPRNPEKSWLLHLVPNEGALRVQDNVPQDTYER